MVMSTLREKVDKMSNTIEEAAKSGSERWKAFFNAGDAAGCASCYEAEATMIAKPFGTFAGRAAIQEFWTNIIADGYSDVDYIDPKIEVIDTKSAVLTSGWKMNKARGVITRELWVMQDDGVAYLRDDHFEVQS